MKHIALDTDIGPDCDDAGALALLNLLQDAGLCRIEAVTNCTSNPYGAGCADAIDRWYGHGEIPVGAYDRPGFLEDCTKYNRYICEHYDNRYRDARPESALRVLRRAFASAGEEGIVLCTIGQFNDAADLLRSGPDDLSPLSGMELVRQKGRGLVMMAGSEQFAEYNVACDVESARYVVENWPGEMIFSPFEIGEGTMTGGFCEQLPGEHPVRKAYELYTGGGKRQSWDLTAAWTAVMGAEPLFCLSPTCRVTLDEKGVMQVTEDPAGRCRILRDVDKRRVEETFDRIIGEGRL